MLTPSTFGFANWPIFRNSWLATNLDLMKVQITIAEKAYRAISKEEIVFITVL